MKKKYINLTMILIIIASGLVAQNTPVLTFSCKLNTNHLVPDSFTIKNITQNCDTTLYYPDSVLNYNTSSIAEDILNINTNNPYPNPFNNSTNIEINLFTRQFVSISVSNIQGQIKSTSNQYLDKGIHDIEIISGIPGLFIVTVSCNRSYHSFKIVSTSSGHDNIQIRLNNKDETQAKSLTIDRDNNFNYETGDKLAILAYKDNEHSGLYDTPIVDSNYELQFATNTPCPGIDSLEYEGQYYNTIQVYNQCWLKENLNIGTMISSSVGQVDNGIIEKYCLINDSVQCDRYGGIYKWDEMMNYSIEEGSQGICPSGWHIATNDDFKTLFGAVDSYFDIGDSQWELPDVVGTDVGFKLKSDNGWYNGGSGSDEFGFSALWGGYLYQGNWAGGDMLSTFYTSSLETGNSNNAIHIAFSWMMNNAIVMSGSTNDARPVRCLKN